MNDRIYSLFRLHKHNLEIFQDARLTLWATRENVRLHGYSEEELSIMLAEHESCATDPTPMVHLTERQLSKLVLQAPYPLPLPAELDASTKIE